MAALIFCKEPKAELLKALDAQSPKLRASKLPWLRAHPLGAPWVPSPSRGSDLERNTHSIKMLVPNEEVLIRRIFAEVPKIDVQPVLDTLGCASTCKPCKDTETLNVAEIPNITSKFLSLATKPQRSRVFWICPAITEIRSIMMIARLICVAAVGS